MLTKAPPAVLTTQKKLFMSQLNECQKRQFLGTEALALGRRGVCEVTQFFGVSKTTVYNSINEIKSGYSAPEIARKMADKGCNVSEYIVRQILEQLGFRRRSFTKDLPMKDVKDRDAQFLNIAVLRGQYPGANTIVILCDGGGSNSSSHRIVEQDLMRLASRLDMNLLVMHYPPYCSKYNPIEHRLFSQITRSWSGAPLLSIEDAARRAAETTTSKGLTVYVDINTKTYEPNLI